MSAPLDMMRQLALPFRHAPHFAAEDVLRGPSNSEALAWLGRTPAWPFGRLALWGGAGRGKTHLLHLWAGRAGAEMQQGPLLRGTASADRLAAGALAVDDADAADEAALLHALNAAAEQGRPVLLAGREAPARWRVRLPDLASRLCATAAVELRAPDDAMLRALLARLLSDRQLLVPDAVQDALLARLPRTAGAVREAVCRLDRTALAAGGPVTRALALQVAGAMDPGEGDGPGSFLDDVPSDMPSDVPGDGPAIAVANVPGERPYGAHSVRDDSMQRGAGASSDGPLLL